MGDILRVFGTKDTQGRVLSRIDSCLNVQPHFQKALVKSRFLLLWMTAVFFFVFFCAFKSNQSTTAPGLSALENNHNFGRGNGKCHELKFSPASGPVPGLSGLLCLFIQCKCIATRGKVPLVPPLMSCLL